MDRLIEKIGPFGMYQIKQIAIIGVIAALSSMVLFGTIFITAEPKLLCSKKESITTSNSTKLKNVCEIRKNISLTSQNNGTQVYKCEFDKTYYDKTIATEWDLYCDRKYLSSLTQTIFMCGIICSIFSGYLGDYYGRKKSVLIFLVILAIILFLSQILLLKQLNLSVTAMYVIYSMTQFLFGAGVNCLLASSFVLLLEFTTDEHHVKFSNIKWYSYAGGELFVMLVAFLSKDWRVLNWVCTGISFGLLILVYFFLDESPRWLVSQKRYEEAKIILLRMAKTNKTNIESKEIDSYFELNEKVSEMFSIGDSSNSLKVQENNEEPVKLTFVDMLKKVFTPRTVLIKTIFVTYLWVSNDLLYYGVSLGITSVEDTINPYVIVTFQAISEAVGYTICLINNKFGHRKTNFVYMLLTGIFCMIVGFIPKVDDTTSSSKVLTIAIVIILLTSLGKAMLSASYNTIYIYSNELYEVFIRNFALTLFGCIGGLGGILAPQINLLEDFWAPFPYLVFSISSFIGTVFIYLLPESVSH